MTDLQINFAETMAKWQAEREAANKAARSELLPQLRALGVTEVVAEYEGYGDSGNIEDVTVQPRALSCLMILSRKSGILPGLSPTTSIRASRTTRAAMAP